ncbi:MAG: hypothetical protein VX498_03965, partial [Myxococcota bacterium]|nr:hypothetical protein [Myxococcota bacterium]
MRRCLLFVLASSLTILGCVDPGAEGPGSFAQTESPLPETEVIPEAKPLWTDDTVKVGSGDFISMLLQEQ